MSILDLDPSQIYSSPYDEVNSDIPHLITAWLNESSSPNIQPFEEDIVTDLLEQIQNQEALIEAQEEGDLVKDLCMMEVNRLKYIITAYLRTRLWKIEQYYEYFLAEKEEFLSEQEISYARNFKLLNDEHMKVSFVEGIPEPLRDIPQEIRRPQVNTHVFCKVLEDVGNFQIDATSGSVEMMKGYQLVLRYPPIEQLLYEGKVKLL